MGLFLKIFIVFGWLGTIIPIATLLTITGFWGSFVCVGAIIGMTIFYGVLFKNTWERFAG